MTNTPIYDALAETAETLLGLLVELDAADRIAPLPKDAPVHAVAGLANTVACAAIAVQAAVQKLPPSRFGMTG